MGSGFVSLPCFFNFCFGPLSFLVTFSNNLHTKCICHLKPLLTIISLISDHVQPMYVNMHELASLAAHKAQEQLPPPPPELTNPTPPPSSGGIPATGQEKVSKSDNLIRSL